MSRKIVQCDFIEYMINVYRCACNIQLLVYNSANANVIHNKGYKISNVKYCEFKTYSLLHRN